MIKRLFWFVLGVVAGVVGVRYVKGKTRDAIADLSIESVAADLVAWSSKALKQIEEIIGNLIRSESGQRSSQDADVFVSGTTPNERPDDL